MAAGRLALLSLIGLTLVLTSVTSQEECETPAWPPALGANPFDLASGQVLLVALVKGYCQYCMGQATNLELLKNHLLSQGFPDIAMILVNGGDYLSQQHFGNLHLACNLSAYQDTSGNIMYDNIFQGNKDDFIIFDRCGQRVAHIPHPYSYLGLTITERVLRAVHRGHHHCHCPLDDDRFMLQQGLYDQMQSDQPMPGGSGSQEGGGGGGLFGQIADVDSSAGEVTGGSELDLDCPVNDRWCRRYVRRMRNGRLRNGMRRRGQQSQDGGDANRGCNHGGCSNQQGSNGRRWGRWNRNRSSGGRGLGSVGRRRQGRTGSRRARRGPM